MLNCGSEGLSLGRWKFEPWVTSVYRFRPRGSRLRSFNSFRLSRCRSASSSIGKVYAPFVTFLSGRLWPKVTLGSASSRQVSLFVIMTHPRVVPATAFDGLSLSLSPGSVYPDVVQSLPSDFRSKVGPSLCSRFPSTLSVLRAVKYDS